MFPMSAILLSCEANALFFTYLITSIVSIKIITMKHIASRIPLLCIKVIAILYTFCLTVIFLPRVTKMYINQLC